MLLYFSRENKRKKESVLKILTVSTLKRYHLYQLFFLSVNHLDIAPAHASVLMGIGNSFATLPGIVSPILSGYIVNTPVST